MIQFNDARKIVLNNCKRLSVEKRRLQDSLGCVLAKDIITPFPFPPIDRSAMDGFVIAKDDKNTQFKLVGEIKAGDIYSKNIKKGETLKIMTGAMVPANADRVLMKEKVEYLDCDNVRVVIKEVRSNIRKRGSEIKKGKKLFSAGEVINAIVLANIAAAGINQVAVYQKPKVGVLVTGSELLKPGMKYQTGKIYDSNGPLLVSLLKSFGLEQVEEIRTKDSLLETKSKIKKLLAAKDVLFLSGGVSVGEHDYVAAALKENGCKIHFNKVAVKPGKPFTFATFKKKPIFAFPGNPVSVLTSYLFFALPALAKIMGQDFNFVTSTGLLSDNFKRRSAKRLEYYPVKKLNNGNLSIVNYQGSADLYSLSKADGLMVVPQGAKKINSGTKVKYVSLNNILL